MSNKNVWNSLRTKNCKGILLSGEVVELDAPRVMGEGVEAVFVAYELYALAGLDNLEVPFE